MKSRKIVALAIAGVLLLAGMGVPSVKQAYAAEPNLGEITVSGTGSVSMVPDVAYVTLGVNTQDASPKTAQEKNNRLIEKVINAVIGMGIAEKDIKTTNFYMYPNYDYNKGSEAIVGYTVSNTVTVTVRDINKVGDVLGTAADAGANVSSGVQFSLLDSTAAYNEALVLAMENASAKAKTIAGALGKSIGNPASVSESGGNYMPVYTGLQKAAMDTAAGASVPVQAGELTVSATVQVVYEYAR